MGARRTCHSGEALLRLCWGYLEEEDPDLFQGKAACVVHGLDYLAYDLKDVSKLTVHTSPSMEKGCCGC